ncbi:MAG: hypothetical protein PF485_05980 [Bacteroidales bacterium]|jgi:hypothetical protein|nr:hypothetical protein [Bacteroidales bacterium]
MLFKLRHPFFLILSLVFIIACNTKKPMTGQEKSEKYKAQIEKKKKREYKKSIKRARERQYDIQAQSSKERWDINQEKSKNWRKIKFHNKPISYRIRKFFEIFKRKPKPEEGLFSKKQKRKGNRSFFKKIFKKKKRKK